MQLLPDITQDPSSCKLQKPSLNLFKQNETKKKKKKEEEDIEKYINSQNSSLFSLCSRFLYVVSTHL